MSPRDTDTAGPRRLVRIIVAADILFLLAVAIALYRHLRTLGGVA